MSVKDNPFKFSTLRLENLKKLREIEYTGNLDEEDLESLEKVKKLPNFKTFTHNEY